ncbi:hypothetical protein EMIHUDRAFT_206255 [Emiliania huxleyi CCMP1516]|uniref:Uncharacterized protein n=2 Tax=Emiliania huxleyi TaxID=2903 RepID=A0A0D3JNP9_EMIH1|nr:hypothetical protein EMIHUDRAFT_206255 [Emiliania huxleyi CCMP1516]EOD25134.1 hypothetical protein EMIHUDRAFT_206255 [Emiliania huxleyi CCMP1516]|eukprot:XP_005777563.1 hypothetical protein EMIHUDRAFT_206255 [Emiliania huxleyi CCMP1516]
MWSSGFGLTIGSIASDVRNITFRHARMVRTVKGIYMKFRGAGSDIVIEEPQQFAIWIGPAQKPAPGRRGRGLARCMPWGSILFGCTHCHAPAGGQYSNITLRDITVLRPKQSAGVLLADEAAAMRGVRFDNVVVHEPAARPFGDEQYYCRHVHGVATGATSPVPPCFEDRTGCRVSTGRGECHFTVAQLALQNLGLTICAKRYMSITSGHGLDTLGSLGTVAVRGKACEGWWNHMKRGGFRWEQHGAPLDAFSRLAYVRVNWN